MSMRIRVKGIKNMYDCVVHTKLCNIDSYRCKNLYKLIKICV